jgi:hypothetical protein
MLVFVSTGAPGTSRQQNGSEFLSQPNRSGGISPGSRRQMSVAVLREDLDEQGGRHDGPPAPRTVISESESLPWTSWP